MYHLNRKYYLQFKLKNTMAKKNFHLMTCLFTALTLFFVSCDKDDNKQSNGANSKRIAKLTKVLSPGTEDESTFQSVYEYDNMGRIVKTDNIFETTYYSYLADKIIVETTYRTDILKLNDNGLVSKINMGPMNIECSYNNKNELIKQINAGGILDYNWNNGNIVNFKVDSEGNGISNYNVTYTNYKNREQLTINLGTFSPNIFKGIYGVGTKNLPASVTSDVRKLTYEYEFDKDGDITKMTIKEESPDKEIERMIIYIEY